jgi:hypothetical protein
MNRNFGWKTRETQTAAKHYYSAMQIVDMIEIAIGILGPDV